MCSARENPTQTTGIAPESAKDLPAKNAAALAEDVPAGLMNFAADPGGTLLHPLESSPKCTAYDAVTALPGASTHVAGFAERLV